MRKLWNLNTLLYLALVLALVGSLKHLAAVFAGVDGHMVLGWVQALAVDVGLFALAYKIKVGRSARQGVKFLTGAVALFTAISVYGNLTYALDALGSLPRVIQVTKPYVLAATLPILVLILAHLLSDDRAHAHELAEREAKRQAKKATAGHRGGSSEKVKPVKGDDIDRRRERLSELVSQDVTLDDLAMTLGVSVSTVKRDLRVIQNGRAVDQS